MCTKKYLENFKKTWRLRRAELKAQMYSYMFLLLTLWALLIIFYLVIYFYLTFNTDSKILSMAMNQGLVSYWGFMVALIICLTAFKAGKIYKKYSKQPISGSYIILFINISVFSLIPMFFLTGMKDSIEVVVFVILVGANFSFGNTIENDT